MATVLGGGVGQVDWVGGGGELAREECSENTFGLGVGGRGRRHSWRGVGKRSLQRGNP